VNLGLRGEKPANNIARVMTGTNDNMIMYEKFTENGRKELQPEGCNHKFPDLFL
jgi:hypothetical protein